MTTIKSATHLVSALNRRPAGDNAFDLPRSSRTLLRIGAVSLGVVGALGASVAGLVFEGRAAAARIESSSRRTNTNTNDGMLALDAAASHPDDVLNGDGVYLPDGSGPLAPGPAHPRVLTILGDSLSVGYGCASAGELPGVGLAQGAAAAIGRPVRLTTHGVPGAVTADLAGQLDDALADGPDVALIIVGANDVRHEVALGRSVKGLAHVVARLRAHGVGVVVASCPDLGVIKPMRQPLRRLAGVWSRTLAREQEKATTRAGGVPVSLSKLVTPAFYTDPELFYVDGFHPSGQGYARAVAALQPAVNKLLRD